MSTVLLGTCLILFILATPAACWYGAGTNSTPLATRLSAAPLAGRWVAARPTTRDPTRTRPLPPTDRPAGLPRTAFDRHMNPAMTPAEVLTLQWYASQARTYVEYGSGASTVQAAPLAGRALSIENGVSWCKQMLARTDVRFWVAQGKLEYVCVNIGATGDWGQPTNLTDNARFPNYVNAIERLGKGRAVKTRLNVVNNTTNASSADPRMPSSNQDEPHVFSSSVVDVVLVDGRFRVATALRALWHIDAASVVLIHDWPSRVDTYGRVLRYYDGF